MRPAVRFAPSVEDSQACENIRREIVGLSNHEKISEIAATVAEKKLVVSNLGLNGMFQKRRDTNVESY